MSILSTIMSKILGKTPASATPSSASTAPAGGTAAPGATHGQAAQQGTVDVGAVLEGLEAQASQELNWKTSIVDLMKLLSMDSSLAARKELAKELHYPGDTSDTATMNVWLHKQIMTKLAENGGKLPDDLKRA